VSKAARTRQAQARERVAAQRAAARRVEARRKVLLAGGSVVAVLAIVVAIIVVKLSEAPAKPGPARASAALAHQLADVTPGTYEGAGTGGDSGLKPTSGQPVLMEDGKPEVLYIGGEFCPYCAAERWAIAAALSRFGALTGLRFIHSSPADVPPSVATLSFAHAGYDSRYLAFTPVEWYGEAEDPSTPFRHVYLQQPTQQEAALFSHYGNGAIPFLDIANQYVLPQTSYLPSTLAGLSWSQVVSDMHDPASAAGRAIDGAANILSAAICKVTHGRPGSVCTSASVKAAGDSL
jgi:Domain of unknown function (DUF929)